MVTVVVLVVQWCDGVCNNGDCSGVNGCNGGSNIGCGRKHDRAGFAWCIYCIVMLTVDKVVLLIILEMYVVVVKLKVMFDSGDWVVLQFSYINRSHFVIISRRGSTFSSGFRLRLWIRVSNANIIRVCCQVSGRKLGLWNEEKRYHGLQVS